MNGSSNVLVLGVTGQVGKRVATNLKRKKATLSVGSRRKANLKELADQFGASRFIDLDDPRTFDEALNNVTSIFLIKQIKDLAAEIAGELGGLYAVLDMTTGELPGCDK